MSTERSSKSSRLRALLAGDTIVRAMGAHNGLTARLAERAGFEAIWASGLEISASYALPDQSLLSMTQFLDAAEAMDAATTVPVIADCDTGFGGPLNVAHAVANYERRGIAGICIEDKIFPKINSFAAASQDLIPAVDFAEKIEAGKSAQVSEDFVLIARTEALVAGQDVAEALDRARTYAKAGADAVLIHSKSRQPREILEFASQWDLDTPLVAVPTTYNGIHESELRAAGFSVVIYANQGLRGAIRGIKATLSELASSGRGEAVEEQISTMSEVFELQGMTAKFESTV
ncbi:isocitrate lyase/phosphoenolpyruvate mutase family protein [Kitasatospora sp. NPDC058162]|uniref:isocitrate lyase/phosphoenolpyruvate mutase family protein n=1 Tax=Kitasatospora sp. NPDC058162 TaxID=3346362 RepID=UPI0036DC17D8